MDRDAIEEYQNNHMAITYRSMVSSVATPPLPHTAAQTPLETQLVIREVEDLRGKLRKAHEEVDESGKELTKEKQALFMEREEVKRLQEQLDHKDELIAQLKERARNKERLF